MKPFPFLLILAGCSGNVVSSFSSPIETKIVDSFQNVQVQKGSYQYKGTKYILERTMVNIKLTDKKVKKNVYKIYQDSFFIYGNQ